MWFGVSFLPATSSRVQHLILKIPLVFCLSQQTYQVAAFPGCFPSSEEFPSFSSF